MNKNQELANQKLIKGTFVDVEIELDYVKKIGKCVEPRTTLGSTT